MTDALITQLLLILLDSGAIIDLGLGFGPKAYYYVLGLTRTTNLTGSTLAAAVSYGFALLQILAPQCNSSPALLPACTVRRDSSPPNPAFRDPVRERGDQVFGEHTPVTAASDDFLNDSLLPRPR